MKRLSRGDRRAPASAGLWAAAGVGTTLAGAAIGTWLADPDSDWYRALDKPRWQPPGWAFPAVWTPLYGSIAWCAARAVSKARPAGRPALLGTLAANLALNTGWNWAFFRRRSPASGLAVTVALDASNIALVRRVRESDPASALALAPYVVWCAFATALNASIAHRNTSAR